MKWGILHSGSQNKMSHLPHRLLLRDSVKIKNTELAEIYKSVSVKTFAESLVGVFVPIYLYNLGFGLPDIFLYFILWFVTKTVIQIPVSRLVGRRGPKHVMSLSYLIRIAYMAMLASFPTLGWSLYWTAPVGAMVIALFFTSYHVNFSKVHNVKTGKDIATVNILVAIASALGPFIGGLLAESFGVPTVLLIATGLMIFAAGPLFSTSEAVGSHHTVSFRTLDWAPVRRQIPLILLEGTEVIIVNLMWPLYMALYLFGSRSYGEIGFVVALSLVAAIAVEYSTGDRLERGQSRIILRLSSLLLAVASLGRIFVRSLGQAVGVDILNRICAVGTKDVRVKQTYELAERQDRVNLINVVELLGHLWKLAAYCALYVGSLVLADPRSLFIGCFCALSVIGVFVSIRARRIVAL
jgi:MFS family permease